MISVVIPVLNASDEYFSQTLKSLQEQSFCDFEVLIVEDPCQHSIENLVADFRDPRFILIKNQTRLGFAGQLNEGIYKSRFAFIARLDADDVACENRFQKQLAAFKEFPEVVLVGSCLKLINENGEVIGDRKYPETSAAIRRQALFCSPVAHPAVMFRKEAVVSAGGYKSEFGMTADYDLWARMLRSGHLFLNLRENLTCYRIHEKASKFQTLRQTLDATIKIKRRYFQQGFEWNFFAQFRLFAETILLRMPPEIVYKLFLLLVKINNNEYSSKV